MELAERPRECPCGQVVEVDIFLSSKRLAIWRCGCRKWECHAPASEAVAEAQLSAAQYNYKLTTDAELAREELRQELRKRPRLVEELKDMVEEREAAVRRLQSEYERERGKHAKAMAKLEAKLEAETEARRQKTNMLRRAVLRLKRLGANYQGLS